MEVFTHDEWGTICDLGFGKIEALVVCKQLGYYGPNPRIHNSTYFGQGNGPVHMRNVKCLKKHTHIGQCKSKRPKPGIQCYTHQQDVGVTCVDGKGTIAYITKYKYIL